jgi:hypothetical protein
MVIDDILDAKTTALHMLPNAQPLSFVSRLRSHLVSTSLHSLSAQDQDPAYSLNSAVPS